MDEGVKAMNVRKANDGRLIFYCQGCESCHGVNDTWTFNGDFENPTFSPSILVRGTQPITDEEHDLIMNGKYVEPRPIVCHSFITDGKMQYLNDCTHSLAGHTVELLNEENWFKD
jgi:hypothetical protein